ncbi:MAG: ABC transporter ATP-binding protein [Armatimonadetes bacterium]|nr:ABC transporter ATP-binding protein [Armatimonadota bacterium]
MVTLEHLRKEYKTVTAVEDLSFRLEEGDIFGFIGPNGAGKTTTIKMLATLLRPTAGTATISGHDVVREPEAVRALIGYMPDFFGVYDDIKVWEYLDFFAAAYKIPRDRRARVVDDVLELTDLTGKRDAYVEELSRGMKQRLCLAKTLVHDPKVLLLDEPASGLDPRARIEIKELLKELRSMGKTILISSHILPELADFCNKIGIIEKGRMVVCGDVQAIMEQVAGGRVLEIRVLDDPAQVATMLEGAAGVRAAAVVANHTIRVEFAGDETDQHALLQMLVQNGVRVQSFNELEADLEDIFMKVTKGIVS